MSPFVKSFAKSHSVLSTELFRLGGSPVSLATLLIVAVLVAIAFIVSWAVRAAVQRGLKMRGIQTDRGVGTGLKILHYTIVFVGIAIAMQTAGIKLTALFAAGAMFAVGLGLALQSIAQNLISGLVLIMERAIKPGEILIVNDKPAKVIEASMRATLVQTRDGEDIIVPNSSLIQNSLTSLAYREPHFRLRVTVGVAYESDMASVRTALLEAANEQEWRAADKEVQAMMLDFGDSSVVWEVAVWTTDPWNARFYAGELREAIWFALKRHSLTIAFPQLDLHVDDELREALAKRAA